MICTTKAEALICPACGARAMTESEKFWLAPICSKPCSACGTRLSIPWSEALFVNWPLVFAFGGYWSSMKLGRTLPGLVHISEAVDLVIFFVIGLVVPIGIFLTFLIWASVRTLDLAPRIRLVVRGPPRAK